MSNHSIGRLLGIACVVLLALRWGEAQQPSPAAARAGRQPSRQEATCVGYPDMDRDASWLLARARQIVASARRRARDGTEIWSPAGLDNFYSSSMYPRDFYYTVDACPECFTDGQIEKAIAWLLKYQKEDGHVPNSVYVDGKAGYWLLDNSQFMVNLVHLCVLRSGNDAFFKAHAGQLEKAMAWLPRNPQTHLVTTDRYSGMYGFNDTIAMLGDDLFTSLLYYEAATKLQKLYARIADSQQAGRWENEAKQVQTGLETLYDASGFFYSCSKGKNRFPSVWGSAFAVYIGATSADQNKAIGNWLRRNYAGCVQAGQVRHLVKPLLWDVTIYPKEVYQNGGYWATAFAWVNRAIRNVDPDLANRMLRECVEDFQKHGINEVVNYDVGYVNRAAHGGEYCASLAPLIVFRELHADFKAGYCDLALSAGGGRATASSVLEGGRNKQRQVGHLNDGLFGDRHSWAPAPSDRDPWFQIELAQPGRIDMIVFGRDNWSAGIIGGDKQHVPPNRTGLSDRNIESLSIRVSSDGQTWSEPIYSVQPFPGLRAGQNYVVKLEKPVACRFVKASLQPNTACIDEFEVYGAPDPGGAEASDPPRQTRPANE